MDGLTVSGMQSLDPKKILHAINVTTRIIQNFRI
jgi:hypothetical protein